MKTNAFLERLRTTVAALEPGERRLLTIAAVLLAILMLYMLLWRPVQKDLTRLRASVPEKRAQLENMRTQAAAAINSLRARAGAAPASGMLLSVVDQSATARGLRSFITRLEMEGSNGLQLVAEAIPFNTFIAWLAELQDQHALAIENASMDAHTASGTVNVKMKLRVDSP